MPSQGRVTFLLVNLLSINAVQQRGVSAAPESLVHVFRRQVAEDWRIPGLEASARLSGSIDNAPPGLWSGPQTDGAGEDTLDCYPVEGTNNGEWRELRLEVVPRPIWILKPFASSTAIDLSSVPFRLKGKGGPEIRANLAWLVTRSWSRRGPLRWAHPGTRCRSPSPRHQWHHWSEGGAVSSLEMNNNLFDCLFTIGPTHYVHTVCACLACVRIHRAHKGCLLYCLSCFQNVGQILVTDLNRCLLLLLFLLRL